MPIRNDLLGLQRRNLQLGEIRMGTSVAVQGKTHRRPVRLETWRFTTASEHAAQVIAAKYGGQVVPWAQKKGRWEVVTDRTAIDVWVPPRGEAVDTNMELWDGPRCLRRCDGVTMMLPAGKPCMCPQPKDAGDPASVQAAVDERIRLSALYPPQACRPLTRINVTIPDLPGLLGVWKLNTGSYNAAVETADSGEAMEIARAGGVYLPAVLRIEWRVRQADGKPYSVPVLQIGLSMREIAEGALPPGPSGLLAQLQGPARQQQAITAGAPIPSCAGCAQGDHCRPRGFAGCACTECTEGVMPDDSQQVGSERGLETAPRPVPVHALNGDQVQAGPGCPEMDEDARYAIAQAIADNAAKAATRAQVEELSVAMDENKCGDQHVCTDRANDVWEQLDEYLRGLWREKGQQG